MWLQWRACPSQDEGEGTPSFHRLMLQCRCSEGDRPLSFPSPPSTQQALTVVCGSHGGCIIRLNARPQPVTDRCIGASTRAWGRSEQPCGLALQPVCVVCVCFCVRMSVRVPVCVRVCYLGDPGWCSWVQSRSLISHRMLSCHKATWQRRQTRARSGLSFRGGMAGGAEQMRCSPYPRCREGSNDTS